MIRNDRLLRQISFNRLQRHNDTISRHSSTSQKDAWRPQSALDKWVERPARPISLRTLTFFGRSLTESRLLESANYARLELPTRISHRVRDLQTLPYSVISNEHMSHVYQLYTRAFDSFRQVPEIKTLDDNDKFCSIVQANLQEHLSVIPRLVMGVIECRHMVDTSKMDAIVNTLLKSRISRRVIAEQHVALTETFHSPWHFPDAQPIKTDEQHDFIGEVFLKCSAKEIVEKCAQAARDASQAAYGGEIRIPEVQIKGSLDATLTYIPSHIEYIIGELLRNSVQATVETRREKGVKMPPIEVLICETPTSVIFRISDQGGGISKEFLPYLWSFAGAPRGPRAEMRLSNLEQVPQLAATMQEVRYPTGKDDHKGDLSAARRTADDSSLFTLIRRPPHLRLGIGLPMSRVYANYWAGSLELQNLEHFGCDAFLTVSKLGNRNEQLETRASMDSL